MLTKIAQDNLNLCSEVCEEFKHLGFNKDIDPRTKKESYNIIKRPNGDWLKATKSGLHEAATHSLLDLVKMPALYKLTILLDEIDPEIKKDGGRIFITEELVYKIKKGTQTPVLLNNPEKEKKKKTFAPYQKLCEEIIEHGLEKDRYRTEETYQLTRAASGEWSMTIGDENHSGIKKIITLNKMPLLKAIAFKINKIDPQFQLNGGRIFITPTRIYRLKNKIEVDLKI